MIWPTIIMSCSSGAQGIEMGSFVQILCDLLTPVYIVWDIHTPVLFFPFFFSLSHSGLQSISRLSQHPLSIYKGQQYEGL